MPFGERWHTLLEEAEDLPSDATLITPLSEQRFRIIETQEHRVIIEFRDSGESRPLQRDQFETLSQRIRDATQPFELDRLPPDAEPYATVLTLHPRFEIGEDASVIRETDEPTATHLLDEDSSETEHRTEPSVGIYSDALLLIDALERHDPSALETLDIDALVDLYTLLSDVQRGANDLRQNVADVLLDRVHHDHPVHAQYGSVQRTTRRSKSLKDDAEVLAVLEEAGIAHERVLGVDPDKVDDALDVTDVDERDVYDIEERVYVRKAEVDEEVKETRLQGLKEQLAVSETDEAAELQKEIETLEARIEDLTGFESAQDLYTDSGVGS